MAGQWRCCELKTETHGPTRWLSISADRAAMPVHGPYQNGRTPAIYTGYYCLFVVITIPCGRGYSFVFFLVDFLFIKQLELTEVLYGLGVDGPNTDINE